ncbi:MFS transporter [Schaedlerella arabinosiphila]|uniref:MFS transporter n=2 Tax=Schaedlerella arabinosiphila TaxID=2044587 RepID=A0A426DDM3_9FIRM|nr:MFS transporter [Schaedlerella arabinosiphila]
MAGQSYTWRFPQIPLRRWRCLESVRRLEAGGIHLPSISSKRSGRNVRFMEHKKTLTFLNYAAILSIFFFSGGGTFMNAAMETMIQAWPELSVTMVRMVTSLPCLVSLPVAILTGRLAGSKISYRFCAVFGTILILVGGVAPFFFDKSWIMILVFRTLLGIGVGFSGMRNALIINSVPEEKKSAMIGYGSSAMNACAMIAGPVVGILAGISWKAPFLYNLLAVFALLLVTFYLKEPEKVTGSEPKTGAESENVAERRKKGGGEKNPEGWKILVYIALQFILTMALYPVLSGMSTYMAAKNIGSPFMAGISTFVYGLFGVLINLVLNRLIGFFRQYMLPAMCLCFSIGMAMVVYLPVLPAVRLPFGRFTKYTQGHPVMAITGCPWVYFILSPSCQISFLIFQKK